MDADALAVVAAAERRARALAAGDRDELVRLHHPELRWTTHRGDVLDRETYVHGNTAGLRWRAQRLEDVRVAVVGDTAVLTAIVNDDVELDGRPASFRLRLTQTWARSPGGWVCVAGHAGPPLEEA